MMPGGAVSGGFYFAREQLHRVRGVVVQPQAPLWMLLNVAGYLGPCLVLPGRHRAPAGTLLCRNTQKMMLGEVVSRNRHSARQYMQASQAAPALSRAYPPTLLDVGGCSDCQSAPLGRHLAPTRAVLCRDTQKMMRDGAASRFSHTAHEYLHYA